MKPYQTDRAIGDCVALSAIVEHSMIPNGQWDLSTRETGKGEPYQSVILGQQHSDAGVDLANRQRNEHFV